MKRFLVVLCLCFFNFISFGKCFVSGSNSDIFKSTKNFIVLKDSTILEIYDMEVKESSVGQKFVIIDSGTKIKFKNIKAIQYDFIYCINIMPITGIQEFAQRLKEGAISEYMLTHYYNGSREDLHFIQKGNGALKNKNLLNVIDFVSGSDVINMNELNKEKEKGIFIQGAELNDLLDAVISIYNESKNRD
jgi:hypothetical protein